MFPSVGSELVKCCISRNSYVIIYSTFCYVFSFSSYRDYLIAPFFSVKRRTEKSKKYIIVLEAVGKEDMRVSRFGAWTDAGARSGG